MMKKIKENKIYLFFVGFIIATILMYMYTEYFDNDFYHIATTGRWIVEHKMIPRINENFVQEGYQTIAQQWLYSIILYESYKFGGNTGVYFFTLFQTILFGFALYKFSGSRGLDKRTAFISALLVLKFFPYLNCRPELISGTLLCIELYILERYKKKGDKKILYILPILTLFEINLHCTYWIFHFIFLLPYMVPFNRLVRGKSKIKDDNICAVPLIMPILFMTVSLFLNPYGLKGVLCIWSSMDLSCLNIGEVEPVVLFSYIFLFLCLGVVALVYLYKRGNLYSTDFYFVIGTSLLTLMAQRNYSLFIMSIPFLLSRILEPYDLSRFYDFFNKSSRKDAALYSLGVVLLILLFIMNSKGENIQDARYSIHEPEKAVKYIKANERNLEKIKVFTDFNGGAYFTWYGIDHVYIQTKIEPYFKSINGKEDITAEYGKLLSGMSAKEMKNFLKKYEFDYLYVPNSLNDFQVYLDLSSEYKCVCKNKGTYSNDKEDVYGWKLYKHSNE